MIKAIKWKNHPVLGNLELNFTKPDGSIYNTIILAGENGTGKTTIMESLAEFLNLGSMEFFEYIRYEANQSTYKIMPLENQEKFGFHKRINEQDLSETIIRNNYNNNRNQIQNDIADIRHYGIAYSKARSDFKTERITATSTTKIDNNIYEIDQNDNFTSLKQLLIDIYFQDLTKLDTLIKQNNKISEQEVEKYRKNSNIYRFEQAFNNFFDKMNFYKVDNETSEEIQFLFEKNKKFIPIDKLSTGEKQIVYRGTHLLKNVKNMNEGIVFIDEPEISMHPKWQHKILDYYQNLFNNNDIQTIQMFFSTHSEEVINSAFRNNNDILIIMLNEKDGVIATKYMTDTLILPSITAAEINYNAFDFPSVDFHILLYGYLQNKTGHCYISDCDKFIENSNIYNQSIHSKIYSYTDNNGKLHTYNTLPTYIRNCIDHPDQIHSYSFNELKISIQLLLQLCK